MAILEGSLDGAQVQASVPGAKYVAPVREFFGELMALHIGTLRPLGLAFDHPVWVAFCTNGVVNRDGEAVMGVGAARFMKEKYPTLPAAVGKLIDRNKGGRNDVIRFKSARLFTFPHQENWRAAPTLSIIGASMRRLKAIVDTMPEITADAPLFIERPGYQPDQTKSLAWERVAPVLKAAGADDRFVFVAPEGAKDGADGVRDADLDLDL